MTPNRYDEAVVLMGEISSLKIEIKATLRNVIFFNTPSLTEETKTICKNMILADLRDQLADLQDKFNGL